MDLDLSVFDTDFDPHKRGKQCLKVLSGIEANKHPTREGKISSFNQKKLFEYAEHMIRRIKRQEYSVSSFEKHISEAWKLCISYGDLKVTELKKEDLTNWWEIELLRYENGDIKHGTLDKEYDCCNSFLKFVYGLNRKQQLPLLEHIVLPKKPRRKLETRIPTQVEVKELIDAAHIDNKHYSVRNQAIMALANDTGARIGEILSMRNKHVRPEKNYLVVSFPESKTAPRTVISFLAKQYLEQWARVSPNKSKGDDAFFFCQENGKPVTYPVIAKSFHRALTKTGIPWKEGKALHYFRSLFSSRAYDWPYSLKHHWMGWSFKDHEKCYTQLDYSQCVQQYFDMLKKENSPFLNEDPIFWDEEMIEDKVFEKLLAEKPEFKLLIKQMVKETMGAYKSG